MIILNTLFPLFALLVLGKVLKLRGITSDLFLKTADKLVYYIFFPVMLFWKVGGSARGGRLQCGSLSGRFSGRWCRFFCQSGLYPKGGGNRVRGRLFFPGLL